MKCPQCGKEFTPRTVVQKYCSKRCGEQYRKTHCADWSYPSITFTCAMCGKTVTTSGLATDKRTRFCSAECEKRYWRHPPRNISPWIDEEQPMDVLDASQGGQAAA